MNTNNPGNITGLQRFFELKTAKKNETRPESTVRHGLIRSFLSRSAKNKVRVRSGSINFRNKENIYKFLKGIYVDILHDAKNNNKKKNNVNGNTTLTAIGTIIQTIGNFNEFLEEYFDMIYGMNVGKGNAINTLKTSIITLAINDSDFYNNTELYFKGGHFEHKLKDEMFSYTGYAETGGQVNARTIVSKYKVSNSRHEDVYYDMESTGDVSRKMDINLFPLILTVPGASDAGIMMAFSLQPYKQLTRTVQNLMTTNNSRQKVLNNTYQRSMNEISFINQNLLLNKTITNFLHERVYTHKTVFPRATPAQLAKYVVNYIARNNKRTFANWKINNPALPDTFLDFRPVSYEYIFNGITLYKTDYSFDPDLNLQKQSLEKRFIQSCRVTINNRPTDPLWSSGPQAWKYVKEHPRSVDAILALLRKESMDRSVYTLALFNDAIHITGDISAMANRTLLYKIYSDSKNGVVPKTAMFDSGTLGTTFIEIRKKPNATARRPPVQTVSNATSAQVLRTVYGLTNNNTASSKRTKKTPAKPAASPSTNDNNKSPKPTRTARRTASAKPEGSARAAAMRTASARPKGSARGVPFPSPITANNFLRGRQPQ